VSYNRSKCLSILGQSVYCILYTQNVCVLLNTYAYIHAGTHTYMHKYELAYINTYSVTYCKSITKQSMQFLSVWFVSFQIISLYKEMRLLTPPVCLSISKSTSVSLWVWISFRGRHGIYSVVRIETFSCWIKCKRNSNLCSLNKELVVSLFVPQFKIPHFCCWYDIGIIFLNLSMLKVYFMCSLPYQ
jgi:hypothetical protein